MAANAESLIPSRTKDRYWIEVTSPSAAWTANSGKSLLFIPEPRIDETWKIISRETMAGRLGVAAKVATALENPLARNQRTKLICVYTYNSEDLADIRRAREALRSLGFTKKIPYKTDAATRAGQYVQSGSQKVSMLFE